MSLDYVSKISPSEGFAEIIKKTRQILIAANRQDIRLEEGKMILTKPPLKAYGVSNERFINFTYSTVDEIADNVLTVHIGIDAVPILLERIMLSIDQCFFTELVLPLKSDVLDDFSDELGENLLNPDYKDLLLNMVYTNWYYSDNPILLDDHELDWYTLTRAGHEWLSQRVGLEHMISDVMIRLGRHKTSVESEFKFAKNCRKEYEKKHGKGQVNAETEKQTTKKRQAKKKRTKIRRVINHYLLAMHIK